MPILDFLDRSAATDSFRQAVRQFARTLEPNDAVVFDAWSPPVKVERTLTKLLESHPELPIERVTITGESGCEYFRGTVVAESAEGTVRVGFEWNCRWKAEQLGWKDWFGFADQTRAAREFGYDCFCTWDAESAQVPSAA